MTRNQPYAVREALGWGKNRTEADLIQWWFHQVEFVSELYCVSGERLLVLSAGERNDGPGPDILNCHIMLDDVELSGAVEMHLAAGDWYRHGHHEDHAYDTVILHVVFERTGGPDLPTFLAPDVPRGIPNCLAQRPVTRPELTDLAIQRFNAKTAHMDELKLKGEGYHAYLLGLIEVVLAGPQRDVLLHEVAHFLDLPTWPDLRKWAGSKQSYQAPGSQPQRLIREILKHQSLFTLSQEKIQTIKDWRDWEIIAKPFIDMGIRRNQSREWLVNVVLPARESGQGLEGWQTLKPFRNYGHEKRCLHRLGISRIDSILLQQGILEWWVRYCKHLRCTACPLIQPCKH
ncbi:MAG: DUF2851 family protein [Candidatus Marinimicrobia bacterium]|nr:DUF2851 family protein [Candidatus Neomarinimicrobiota bacterium]MCF7850484.1 DUF2851 family protein [Candidatus Neomarinimicrobiota bacterium]MCF7905369.1 DUF2851 family protein [Candidatus Neomarinimicrobiota bacterium]